VSPATYTQRRPCREPLPQFDADFAPEHFINQKAAKSRGLTWDANRRAYVDADGCLLRDQFGQQL
jgi:hypothetical protein